MLRQAPALVPAVTLALALGATATSLPARAAGWDTPILYTAEHMGMGGAAIGYVDDPSALFHNPAGLAAAEGLSVIANASVITGHITASPTNQIKSRESERILSIAPLLGVSYKIADWVSAGLAFYPVAAAGGSYEYTESGNAFENTTSVTFLELSPGVAFNLPGNLRLGVGYRISFVTLERVLKGTEAGGPAPVFDATLSGQNFAGIRLGLQWDPIPELQLGLSYRHKTSTDISTDKGVLLSQSTSIDSTFVLPSRLGFGARANFGTLGVPLALVLDLEYGFQSQNEESVFQPGPEAVVPAVNSVFEWHDAITLRTGVEYAFDGTWFVRAGYIFDGTTSRTEYASAFGTPPAPTHTVTAGVGYHITDDLEANLAFAYRMGSTTVTPEDLQNRERTCLACGFDGDYKIALMGSYLDVAYSFR